MSRRERIVFLLEHLGDCTGPASSAVRDGGDGEGPGFVLTSSMAEHPSVVELVRCLRVMRRAVPRHHEHLVGFYLAPWYVERRSKTVRKGGRVVTVRHRDGSAVLEVRRVRDVPPWVEPRLVEHGLDMLCGLYSVDPSLPKALLAAAA